MSELRYDPPTINEAAAVLRAKKESAGCLSPSAQVLLDFLENGAEEAVSVVGQSKDHRDAARHIQTMLADDYLTLLEGMRER